MRNGTDVYTSAWVWTLNASFNSNSKTIMLVAYCFIKIGKTSFLFLFPTESVKILVRPHAGSQSVVQTGIYVRDVFMKIKQSMDRIFAFKLEN